MSQKRLAGQVAWISGAASGITGTSLVIDVGYTATAEWETTGRTKFME